jgi:bifunctional non-homologous end joining protein LigD
MSKKPIPFPPPTEPEKGREIDGGHSRVIFHIGGKRFALDFWSSGRELNPTDAVVDPIRYSPVLEGSLKDLLLSVRTQGLEGLVAKRRDSKYEPGLRSGAWMKMRVNAGQELVIAGYTPSAKNFDALVIGYYDADKLIYAARTRNGFTPASRVELYKKIKPLEIQVCPFANLPEKKAGRWGAGLTAAKMEECRWLKPVLVGQFEFVQWTEDAHLRHSRFMALRDDKKAMDVRRE